MKLLSKMSPLGPKPRGILIGRVGILLYYHVMLFSGNCLDVCMDKMGTNGLVLQPSLSYGCS